MPSAGPNRLVSKAVLDASAILALINQEPGAHIVAPIVRGALVVAVNVAEVITKLVDYGAGDAEIEEALGGLSFVTVPFDEMLATAAGQLRRRTRAAGLSLADRACLALAASTGLPALTADRIWTTLDLGVTVRLIR